MIAASNDKIIFHVKTREIEGKKVSQLRNAGSLPGNVYGLSEDSQAVVVDQKIFAKLYAEEGDTGLIYLNIDESKKQIPVLIDEVDYHPVTGALVHAVFRRVNLAEKIEAEVPIELVGENDVPGSMVLTVRDSLEVMALPAEIPEKFTVDISTLKEFGDTITIADLDIDLSKVEVVITGDMDMSDPVVLLQEVKEEVEEEVAEPEEVEITGEKADKEEEEEQASEKADESSGESGE